MKATAFANARRRIGEIKTAVLTNVQKLAIRTKTKALANACNLAKTAIAANAKKLARQTKAAIGEDLYLALLTLVFGGVYLYLLATTRFALKFVALWSGAAGAVFYYACYFAPAFCARKLLGTQAKTPQAIALAQRFTRAIALAFVVVMFFAVLSLAPIALIAAGGYDKDECFGAAFGGAFIGLAIFTCLIERFKRGESR